ncbi:hypothetical protein RO3G_01610 [Lichtheimia corymbifera JMRC:FSU:9682]|uniref:CCHC-type domain-containing protein n=1 Tax=Lichtheimia corymbifera JMRC:FSU:9682 TaxID=1263082 RepID=A0A068RSX4_9FUNG|nr:hypothetical protein RO3G_01610 [Lichtheimia corymbifera JMRC:FSU:9682]
MGRVFPLNFTFSDSDQSHFTQLHTNTLSMATGQLTPGRRSWANVVRNKSITLFEEHGYEEARRARQAETILTRALNPNAVIFDFGTNLPSKSIAYQTIKQLGTVLGARTISRSRNPRSLLIETRFDDDNARDKALTDGVTYDGITYRATRALSADAEITKVNFSHLPFLSQEVIEQVLRNAMGAYGRVCQIRLYVEPESETFEGEATVILDTSTPSGAIMSDDKPFYRPLTRLIPIEAWDDVFPASWKNAPPLCRYCNTEGHRKMECPKLQELTCFHCHQKGHFRRHCPVVQRERQVAIVDSLTDSQLLDTYPTTASAVADDHDSEMTTSAHSSIIDDIGSNPTNDQHTDTVSQPDVEDQHMTNTNLAQDFSTPTTGNPDTRMIIDNTPQQDNDYRMTDNNDRTIAHDQHQHTPAPKKPKFDTASSTRVTRNMSQQRLQSQQSARESPDPQHHQ